MRIWITALLVVVFASSASVALAAKGNKANKKKDGGATSTAGSVVSVTEQKDKAGAYDIMVSAGKGKKAHTVTLTADANTRITINGIGAKASELKYGQKATWSPAYGTLTRPEAKDTAAGKKGDKANKAGKSNKAGKGGKKNK